MHYAGPGSKVPALTRAIIETELIDAYHWTFEEIDQIPYRRLQQHFMIKKQREEVNQHRASVQKFKSEQTTRSSGQSKRFYREV